MPKKDRNLVGIDVDPKLQALVSALADQLKVPRSQIYNLLIAKGLLELQEENLDIWNRLKPSKSIRYKHNIDIDDILELLQRLDE